MAIRPFSMMNIQEEIQNVFSVHPGIPLFYIESGSRLWGFESPDSDFDVRGFHLQTKGNYFDYRRHPDVIEQNDGLFDFVSFDLDKMFNLLAASNPNCLEWLRGHIQYLDNLPELEWLRESVFSFYEPRTLYHHYLSLARNNIQRMENDTKFTYKTVLYCLRGILSAEVSARGELPPLLITELIARSRLEKNGIALIEDCVDKKKKLLEKTEIPDKAQVLQTIHHIFDSVSSLPTVETGQPEKLRTAMSAIAIQIKENYYG
jgi:uncharacterized protein